jgi:membrane-associated protease RseP (regulator of RpoE activity)
LKFVVFLCRFFFFFFDRFQGLDVGGPISIINTGSELIEGSSSIFPIFGFAASLSANLAILNSVPFPGLDGGQFVVTLGELISGKKLPRQAKEIIGTVAFLLLAYLSLSALLMDVGNLSSTSIPKMPSMVQ